MPIYFLANDKASVIVSGKMPILEVLKAEGYMILSYKESDTSAAMPL
jgi:hypothetical protein